MPGKRPSGRTPAGKGNGPGMGAGWGGAAKGAHPQRPEFTPETSAAANTHRVELMQTPEWWAQKANRDWAAAQLKANIFKMAFDLENENARVTAARHLDDKLDAPKTKHEHSGGMTITPEARAALAANAKARYAKDGAE